MVVLKFLLTVIGILEIQNNYKDCGSLSLI